MYLYNQNDVNECVDREMIAINKSRVRISSISLRQCFHDPRRVSRRERLLLESMPRHYLRYNETIAIMPRPTKHSAPVIDHLLRIQGVPTSVLIEYLSSSLLIIYF